jgi:protein O-mannosyl-transferase
MTTKTRLCAYGVVIALAGFAAYSNSFHGQFINDDLASIPDNPSIRQLWPLQGPLSPPHSYGCTVDGRPILNLSLALNYAISGTNVWSYHALNLLIHILAGLTLFGIVRRTLANQSRKEASPAAFLAFFIALLWTVHPLQTESVAYVIQRAESLMGFFYLLMLYFFIRGTELASAKGKVAKSGERSAAVLVQVDEKAARRLAHIWFGLSWLACFLGMGTKEVTVTAPIMVLMYDRTFAAGGFREALRRRRRYYLGLAATWIFLAALMSGSGGNRSGSKGFGIGVSWWAWGLTQFKAIVNYLRLALWPHPLVFNYGTFWVGPGEAAPYALIVLALAAGVLWALLRPREAGRRWQEIGFLGFWFFGLLAVTSLVPGNGEMIVERRMYLPLAAVLALIVPVGYAWAGKWSFVFFSVLALAFGGLTWRRNEDFKTDLSIWSDTVAKRPGNADAQYNLGVACFDRGRVAEAEARYREALRLDPQNAEAHHSLANTLFHEGSTAEAVRHFKAALAARPAQASIHYDYGTVLFQSDETMEAIAQYEEALRLQPDYAEAHDNLGVAWAKLGRGPEAIAEFLTALRLDPGLLRAHVNLAGALAGESRFPEAAAEYEAALRIDPGFVAAHFYLGNVLCQEGRFAEAIPNYEAALRANPDNADAHHNLGVALAEVGRNEEAKTQFNAAAELGGAH